MRPSLLNPLFSSITSLPGVGPKLEKLYRRLLDRDQTPRLLDLLLHMPTGAIDRRARPKLRDVELDRVVTVAVTIDRHRPPPPHRPRAPYQVFTSDETGDLILTFFTAHRDYLKKLLPAGERRYVSGKAELYDGMLQMVHPDRIVAEADLAKLPLVEPVYPLTEGLSHNQLRRATDAALERLPEWQEAGWVARERFPAFAAALATLHRPRDPADVLPEGLAWSRLAYDELLAGQLALALVRAHLRRPAGKATQATGHLRRKLIEALPYSLTPSQTRAVADIVADLERPQRMLRLLQGDVGSGKTVVALLACAAAIEGGRQAAVMAPTEILARQHFDTMRPLATPAGINVAILTGRERGRERSDILAKLAFGDIHVLVGTHALFQEDVEFRDLALAVVDEQHRFGVHQRLALARKGEAVDVLVMTATPIPRTLVLTYFGDMDVSELRESRPGGGRSTPGRSRSLDSMRSSRPSDARSGKAAKSTGCARWSKSPRTPIWRRHKSVSPRSSSISATRSIWCTVA
jgi:ATP-dependent DNA helicase RecG